MGINLNMDFEKYLIKEINGMVSEDIKIMEVCGTHTQKIAQLGLRSVVSSKVKFLSGPGCPVCVTEESYIELAIKMLNTYDIAIATFGDLIRVRGTEGCLLDEKAMGKEVRVICSPMDLIGLAEANKAKKFVFLGVGFETTAPVIALTIKTAAERGIKNLFFLTAIKLMPPILHYIFGQPNNEIRGLICPGHVATVKGSNYFRFIGTDYGIPAAVCGFEAGDIIIGIHYLVKKIIQNEKHVYENQYKRCVRAEGNPIANRLIDEVFQISKGEWRGIGRVENSALTINEKYAAFNAMEVFAIEIKLKKVGISCECKDILLGNKTPGECKLFGRICSPGNPYGPCMVSMEGSCAIAYRYREEI